MTTDGPGRGAEDGDVNMIERLRARVRAVASESGLLSAPVQVEVKRMPPEAAIGDTADRDYPIWKGKEGIVEARVLGGTGQAFTPAPEEFRGDLTDLLSAELAGAGSESLRNRGLLVAASNALCSHLRLAHGMLHCRDDGPRECANELSTMLGGLEPMPAGIALIGCQPRMVEAIAARYPLRVTDLDPDNIGKHIGGVEIEGEERTDEVLAWCDLALVTGTTLVNGTIDRFLSAGRPVIFYGITIAGAASLCGLSRFCPKAIEPAV